MKSTELTPFAYTPYTIALTLCTLPNEIMEYLHARTGPLAEVKNLRAMGEIIADVAMELWTITNAAINRIDALQTQLRVCSVVASTSPVKESKGAK